MTATDQKKTSVLQKTDFLLEVFEEKIPQAGEDSFLCLADDRAVLLGVFDGCGGSGARKYQALSQKTGAYISSRAAAAAAGQWFGELPDPLPSQEELSRKIKEKFKKNLSVCQEQGKDPGGLKGKLTKDFPTTAALLLYEAAEDEITVCCLWAGDSRCYLLTDQGLCQLTRDDLQITDAMENLTADGILTNVISASRDFEIHSSKLTVSGPCILFSATDGCFGYFSTPMEFEHLLLSTMQKAENPSQWEEKITEILKDVAGDDFTLMGAALGWGSFDRMQKYYKKRTDFLSETYLKDLEHQTQQQKIDGWNRYRTGYETYLKLK